MGRSSLTLCTWGGSWRTNQTNSRGCNSSPRRGYATSAQHDLYSCWTIIFLKSRGLLSSPWWRQRGLVWIPSVSQVWEALMFNGYENNIFGSGIRKIFRYCWNWILWMLCQACQYKRLISISTYYTFCMLSLGQPFISWKSYFHFWTDIWKNIHLTVKYKTLLIYEVAFYDKKFCRSTYSVDFYLPFN